MPAVETSFDHLAGIPVRYGHLKFTNKYGSKSKHQSFKCRKKLKDTLGKCLEDLFDQWDRGVPNIILAAGQHARLLSRTSRKSDLAMNSADRRGSM